MYYIILIAIAVILFLLRKRILGGIVGVFALTMVIAFTIFLLDFFWLGQGFLGIERDVRNFEPVEDVVSKYDKAVKDPNKAAKDLGGKVKDKGLDINEKLEETGGELDNKLGIKKNEGNNNLWEDSEESEEVSEKEKSESNKKQESGKEEESEKEGILEKVKDKFKGKDVQDEKVGESIKEEKNKQVEGLVKFEDIDKTKGMWGLSEEDYKFVKSASPFNKGKFNNGSVEIEVKDEGVVLLEGGSK